MHMFRGLFIFCLLTIILLYQYHALVVFATWCMTPSSCSLVEGKLPAIFFTELFYTIITSLFHDGALHMNEYIPNLGNHIN